MSNIAERLGVYELDAFDTHASMGEHGTKGIETLNALNKAWEEAGNPLPQTGEDLVQRYLRDGHFAHAYGPGSDRSGNPVKYKLLHAVALGRDPETKLATVDGIYSDSEEPAALDAMYYTWLRRVLPDVSFTRYLDYGEDFYTETADIVFERDPDEHTEKLLQTFGLEEDGKWVVPLPRITLVGSPQTISELLEDGPPPADRTVALIEEESSGSITHFFDKGEEIGSLKSSDGQDALLAVDGSELEIEVPDHSGSVDMTKLFEGNQVRRQLGLVTLKRAL